VKVHVKVTVRPTEAARQPLLLSLSSANWATPPLQDRRPLGPSTLWGSYWICPHCTVCWAHWACRLAGELT
jgi:hypothetical protein